MSNRYGETVTTLNPSPTKGVLSQSSGSATRYLRGKDRYLLEDDDPDMFDLSQIWDSTSSNGGKNERAC
jgi:hypothetical protein